MPDDGDLQRLIYACATGAGGWQPFLDALAAQTRAQAAALVLGGGAVTGTAPLPDRATLWRMRPDRVYGPDIFDAAPGAVRAIRLAVRPDLPAWTILHRPHGEFRATDGALLARLVPALAQGLAIWLDLSRERAAMREDRLLARALGAHWLWLDRTGRLVAAGDGARAALEAPGLRLSPGGWIEAAAPEVARALRRALDLAAAGTSPAPVPLAPGLHLALHQGLTPPAPGMEPALRAALRRPPLAADRDPARWGAALGLNRSEARLAALLCDGESLAGAAARLGWTAETARSTSKRLFALTGTHGQPALVRRLQTGAEWLTGPPLDTDQGAARENPRSGPSSL